MIDPWVNKREYFRIPLVIPLCAHIRIKEIKGNDVTTKSHRICVLNIGPGGLLFQTPLCIPVSKDVVYEFSFKLFGDTICLRGTIVRKQKDISGSLRYGAEFVHPSMSRSEEFTKFNKLASQLKRVPCLNDCSFCVRSPGECV